MRYLITALVLLCAGDAFLTDVGLTHAYISEHNPIMHMMYFEAGVAWFYILKIGLPLTLYFLYKRIKSKLFSFSIVITLIVYLSVLPLHFYWILQIP